MSSIWPSAGRIRSSSTFGLCRSRVPSLSTSRIPHVLPVASGNILNAHSRGYAAAPRQRLDTQRLRRDVDEKSRLGFYTLSQRQGALNYERDVANAIFNEFAEKHKIMDLSRLVEQLSSKYKVSLDDLSGIAIVTMKIPDLSDPEKRAQLPPSQHKPLAAAMLKGCAQLQDPLAILQILTAVYLADLTRQQSFKDIAFLYNKADILEFQKALETLSSKSDLKHFGRELLTLRGLFFEKAGQKVEAQKCYTDALRRGYIEYNPKNRHPMQLPLPRVWNTLGYLLKKDKDPGQQQKARECFETGAFVADDPLSFYELAQFEDRTDPKWLQYTSKAAASGHRQATVDLAQFYQEVDSKDSALLANRSMQKALAWLRGWRRGSTALLAREWLQAASIMGHKPSSMQLADYYEEEGDAENAKQCLRRATELSKSGEEWPQIMQAAKKRLAGIKE